MDSADGGNSVRIPVIAQLCPQQLADLLNALGDLPAMLLCSLRLAMCVTGSERGVAFDSVGASASIGFSAKEAAGVRERLSSLSARAGLVSFRRPGFEKPAETGDDVRGVACVIAMQTAVFIIAVERKSALIGLEEQLDIVDMMELIRPPLAQTAELLWLREEKKIAETKIRASALPLNRLEALPQLEELELMLIEEALHRFHGNKTRVAEVLGVTREGLRKKIVRLTQKLALASNES